MFDNALAIPVSREIADEISSIRATRASPIALRYFARSAFGSVLHEVKAAFAAAAALVTSPAVPSGIVAMTSSLVESKTEIVFLPSEATHWPLI
ncbi:unannotated protein [freshwater metagenome]|uniref:Unannotated protein n=1 Tax=freshwater metagenome TaxID=449393 RepID=A0A6J6NJT8_9ZZZZ